MECSFHLVVLAPSDKVRQRRIDLRLDPPDMPLHDLRER